jgi:hypothetical protein
VKYLIAMLMRLLTIWALGTILLSASYCFAEGIEGHWLAETPSGSSVIFGFGPEYAFYMEDGSSWIQGTYTTQSNTMPRQLNLYIEEGSDVEEIGKQISYHYNIDANLLTLTTTENSTALNVDNSSEGHVFIGVNLDSYDEDDDDGSHLVIYASCFIGELAGILISP